MRVEQRNLGDYPLVICDDCEKPLTECNHGKPIARMVTDAQGRTHILERRLIRVPADAKESK